jgi:hypothetical protein
VTYTGNAAHKTYHSPAGPPAIRADKAKCDRFADSAWPRLLEALREAIVTGFVSEFRDGYPARAWVWINQTLHEARLTVVQKDDEKNLDSADYHGFPINDPRQFPEPAELLQYAPRVQIPTI